MARQRNFPCVSVRTRCLSRSDQKAGVSAAVSSPRSTSVPPQKFGRRLGATKQPSTSLFHPSGSSGHWQPRPEPTCATQKKRRLTSLTSHLATGTCRRGRSEPMLGAGTQQLHDSSGYARTAAPRRPGRCVRRSVWRASSWRIVVHRAASPRATKWAVRAEDRCPPNHCI